MRRLQKIDWRAPSVQRWVLVVVLVVLVVTLLGTLIYLAGRLESDQMQRRVDAQIEAADQDLRKHLAGDVRSLQALMARHPSVAQWQHEADVLLAQQREILRLEWRDETLRRKAQMDTPFRRSLGDDEDQIEAAKDMSQACALARQSGGAAYSASYFVPQEDGLGTEMMAMCWPLKEHGHVSGYLVARYGLADILSNLATRKLARSEELTLTELDGTRLAASGAAQRGVRLFSAQKRLDLPGNPMVLRLNSWQGTPDVVPNFLTALVTVLALALVVVLVMLVRDTRRRLSAELELAEALAFRKAMEDSLVTGLRARSLQGHITYVNPAFCEMVGFSAEELRTQLDPPPYWPDEWVAEYRQVQQQRVATQGSAREGFEALFKRKSGEVFPVLVVEAPLINAAGVQTGWMSAVLDLSEKRRIEELSRATQERLQATARLATVGEMASLLSHELNQPLAAISSYANGSLNLLENGLTVDAAGVVSDLQMALGRIAEQSERAGRVIKSVNDFVRRRKQLRESVGAVELLSAILPLVNLQARKSSVRVVTNVSPQLPQVQCDRTMVEQVLLNLTRNAMQAMEDMPAVGRILEIRARLVLDSDHGPQRTAQLEWRILDRGLGIPPEVAEHLFTPFFTTKNEGMGLGLSLCRTVAEQHGGALEFEPNRPQGAVFVFTLPLGPT